MKRMIVSAAVALLLVLAGAARADEPVDALKIILSMKDAYKKVDSYTAVMVKGEPALTKELVPQKIRVKFQRPFKVYMKWVEEPYCGRELIYVEGENDGNFIVKPDGIIGFVIRLLRLPSTFKSDESRYTVRDFGVGNLIDGIVDITMDAKRNDDLDLRCKGIVSRNGRDAYLIERLLPKKSCYRNQRLVLYVDTQTLLPFEVYAYGPDGKLSEFCIYQGFELNPQLTAEDFSTDNREYGFRYF